MPSRLQPATRTDFSGGIDAVSSPYQIGPKQVMRATNLILDEQGALDVRDGATTIDQGPSESERILSLDDVVKVSGTLIKLAVVRWQNGSQHLYERLSPAWAVRGLFSTAADLPQMLTFVNLAIVANGYETIKYYDGTTFGSLTAAPRRSTLPSISILCGPGTPPRRRPRPRGRPRCKPLMWPTRTPGRCPIRCLLLRMMGRKAWA